MDRREALKFEHATAPTALEAESVSAARGASLEVRGLCAARSGDMVINNLDLSLPAGASLALVGESGCGKSTLLESLAGLLKPVSGAVHWHSSRESDSVVSGKSAPRHDSMPKAAFVWQNLGLFPWKRVEENLALPLVLEKRSREEVRARVADMLKELGLSGLERRFPDALSGGQRQRLALGRALVANPEILFLDEPFSALDALRRERLQEFLIGMRQKRAVTIVFVTHDIPEAVFLASHILMLAAHPFRVLGLVENPLRQALDEAAKQGDTQTLRLIRESDEFAASVRNVHVALRRAQSSGAHRETMNEKMTAAIQRIEEGQ